MKKSNPLHWEAFEYEMRERSSDWFWAVGIITVAVAVTAIIFNNVLFAVVILLGGFVLSMYAAKPPRKIDVVIDEIGIRVDRHFFPFRSLESFWIDEHHHVPKMLVKSQRLIMPYISIPLDLDEVEADDVRRYTSRFIPEIFHGESIFEKILERLGF